MSFTLPFSPHIASPAPQTISPGQAKKRAATSIDQELTEQFASLQLTQDAQADLPSAITSRKQKERRVQPAMSSVLSRVKKRLESDTPIESAGPDSLNVAKLARHHLEPSKALVRKRSFSATDSEPVADGQVVRSRHTRPLKYNSRSGVPVLLWLHIPATLAAKAFKNAFAKNMVAAVCNKFSKSVSLAASAETLFELSMDLYSKARSRIGHSLRERINLLIVSTFQAADALKITGHTRGDPQKKRLIHFWREQIQANEREYVSKTDTNVAIVRNVWQRGRKGSSVAKKAGIIKH